MSPTKSGSKPPQTEQPKKSKPMDREVVLAILSSLIVIGAIVFGLLNVFTKG